jgi:hypothetical protein
VTPTEREWSSLARGTRRRWIAAYGGKGSPERRAERARDAYERGEHLSSAQRGHEPREIRSGRAVSAFFGPNADFVVVDGLDRAEVRRMARYDALVGQLAAGRVTPSEFRRRVESWRPIASRQLTSDPSAVLARLERLRAADLEVFAYASGRAS